MYTNTSHYGGDAHIWTREQGERLREAGPHETSEASLCEHHAVTEASDLFHVRDVASDWQTFLQEDLVCDECAQEWRERRGLVEQRSAKEVEAEAADWLGRLVQETPTPVHPNCRSSVVPQTGDDGSADAADAARYATASYARFVEYGRDDEGAEGAAAAAVPQGDPATLAPTIDWSEVGVDAQVDAALDSVGDAAERAAQHLRDHSFEVEVTLTPEQAEALRDEMGLE